MADKPMYDRYAPHEQATIAALEPVENPSDEDQATENPENIEVSSDDAEEDTGEEQFAETTGDGLEDLDKDELIEVARKRGVAIYGTKRDIIERLRS